MPEEAEGMYGKFNHTMDAKGRLFVPSRLRDALGDTFYVMIGFDKYLTVYPAPKWKEVEAIMKSVKMSQSPRFRFIYANLAKCEPDKQGRFLLPPLLREYAHLDGEVTILGQGDHAEIWNAADYAARELAFLEGGNLLKDFEEMGL